MDQSVKIPPLLSLDFAYPNFPSRPQGFFNMRRYTRRPPLQPCMERSPYFEMDIEESSSLEEGMDRPNYDRPDEGINRSNYSNIDMASIVERPPWFGVNFPPNNGGIVPFPANNERILPNCENPQNCARPQQMEAPTHYGGWRNMDMSNNFGWNMGVNHFNVNEIPLPTDQQMTPNMKMIKNSLRSLGIENKANYVGAQIENTTHKETNIESETSVEHNNNNTVKRGVSIDGGTNIVRGTIIEEKDSLQIGTERRASIARGTSIESEVNFEKITSMRRGTSMDGLISTQREMDIKRQYNKPENPRVSERCIDIDSSPEIMCLQNKNDDNDIPFITDSGTTQYRSVEQENAALRRKVEELHFYLQDYAEKIKIFKSKALGYKTKCKEYQDQKEKLILSGSPLVFGAGDQKKRQRDKMIIEKDCKIMDLKEELHSRDKKITELSNEILSKDLEIISLKREKEELEEEKKCWEEKEDMGEHLKDQVSENNSLIDQIQDMAMRFEDILNEKNEEISSLQMISNEKDKNIEMDIDILNKKNSEIKKMTQQISLKDKEIIKLRQFSEELQDKLKVSGRMDQLIDDTENDTQHLLCNERNENNITQSSMLNDEEEYLERNVKVEKQEYHELREIFDNNNDLPKTFENTDMRDSHSIDNNSEQDFRVNELKETSENADRKNNLMETSENGDDKNDLKISHARLKNNSYESSPHNDMKESCLGDDLKKKPVTEDSNNLKDSYLGNGSGESTSSNELRESIDSNWSDVNIKLEEIVESFYPELKDTAEFPICVSPSTSLTLSSSTHPILCSMSPLTMSTMTSLITPVITQVTDSLNADKSIVDLNSIASIESQTVTSMSAITTLTPFSTSPIMTPSLCSSKWDTIFTFSKGVSTNSLVSSSPIMTPSLCSSMDSIFTFSDGLSNSLVSYAVTTPPSSPNPAHAQIQKQITDKKYRSHSQDSEEKLDLSRRTCQFQTEASSYFDEIKKKYYRQRRQQIREDTHERIISIRHSQRKMRKFVTRKRSCTPEPRRKITHERRRSLDNKPQDDRDDYFKVKNDNDYYNRITKDRKITIIDDPRDVDIRETVHSLKESKNKRTVTLVRSFNFLTENKKKHLAPSDLFNKPGLPIRVEMDEKRLLGPNCQRCFEFHHESVCPEKTTTLKCRYPPCTNKVGHITRTCHELMMRCRLPECNNQRGHRSDCHYNPEGVKPFGRGRLAAYRLKAVFLRYRHLLTSDERRRISIYQEKEETNNNKLRGQQQTFNYPKFRIYHYPDPNNSKVKIYPEPNNSKVKIYPEPNNYKKEVYSEPNNCKMRMIKRRRKSSETVP